MIKISDHITVFQSALWQLNSCFCHYLDTDLLWDPAYSDKEIDAIYSEVYRHHAKARYVIYTHGDYDHIAGDAQFPDFEKVGSGQMALRSGKEQILSQIHAIDHEFYIDRLHTLGYPSLDRVIQPSEPVHELLGNVATIFIEARGHTADGLITVIPELKLMVSGDYLSDIEFPFIEDSLEEYHKTLDRIVNMMDHYNIEFMVPGHGCIAFTASEIHDRIIRSKNYLESLMTAGDIPDWRKSWGNSPFGLYLDKAHQKNIAYVRSQNL
jgi:glyoxylase-like metal-dependent hydrolase (beta-lactamase superfamily II)